MKIVKPDPITTTGYVTRTGTATYYDSNGYLKTSADGALRFGYNPSSLEFNGLIVEDAATNYIDYSNTFNDVSWTNRDVTYSSGQLSPENLTNATKIIPNTVNGQHNIRTSALSTPVVGNTYVASIYVKASGYNIVRLSFGNFDGTNSYYFRLDTGTVGIKVGEFDPVVEKLSNGFYRLGVPVTAQSTSFLLFTVSICVQESLAFYQGDGVSGVICYGAQTEIGSRMTSYIATNSLAVSRSAEVITGSGLLYTNVTNPYSEWSSATTYSLGQIVVVGTYTGTNIVDITNSGTYKSLTNSNLNNNPITSPTSWVRIGPTNQFAVFDNVISSSTVKDSDIVFVVKSASVDSVAVLNSVANKISFTVSDASYSETFLYNIAHTRTTQLNGSDSIDWFSYFFFDEYVQKTQAIYLDIPQVTNGIVSIKISGTVNVTAGSFIEGQVKLLGATQYGASAGITDYSKKEVDEFGNTVLVVRNYSKRMQAKMFLSNSNLNTVQRILYSIRATPVLWIASDDSQLEEPMIVMGYYKDFDTEIAYPAHSLCNLTIEGLI